MGRREKTIRQSEKWKQWLAEDDEKTCKRCFDKQGKIYSVFTDIPKKPPLHFFCRCVLVQMLAILAGEATTKGSMGADWFLLYFNRLPDYYISRNEAESLGWNKKKGNLNDVAPEKMIYGGIYHNDDEKLPEEQGRIWYEADINYTGGYRNQERIVFSNDGIVFVTYDHYKTFYEVMGE